jgi:hypothetical protein
VLRDEVIAVALGRVETPHRPGAEFDRQAQHAAACGVTQPDAGSIGWHPDPDSLVIITRGAFAGSVAQGERYGGVTSTS